MSVRDPAVPTAAVNASAATGPSHWNGETKAIAAFRRGLLVGFTTPGFVLFLTALGFGTLVRDVGLTPWHALFLSAFMYALPAQVMVVDQLQRGAGLVAVAIAVTLTAVRLLPMTVSLLPWLTAAKPRAMLRFLAVHFVAITSWVEGSRRLPHIPEHLRLAHFYGIGLAMMVATALGSITGFVVAGAMPVPVQAALLFMTPLYFFLSTISGAHHRRDWLAIGLGTILTPLIFMIWPEVDLLIAGLVGGTIAYLGGRLPL